MASSRHIGRICLAVTFVTLLITVLFMNGKAIGLTAAADGDGGDGFFTANDLDGAHDFSGAVRITLSGDGGVVDGGGAYFLDGDLHILSAGEYVLSGELTDGSVVVDAEKGDKIWILLEGVSLHCEKSAALRVEQAEKVFLTLADGTVSSLSGGTAYAQADADSGIDGVIYSRDDLTVNGSGTLYVDAQYQHGIVCNDDLVIAGGTIDITAVQDGIHANDSARFTGAELVIRAGDDGITVSNDDGTGYVYVASGRISIPDCYEGIEGQAVTVAGGTIDIAPTDDGINAGGGADALIRIEGGDIIVINEAGRDADGLDSNGDIVISGGSLFISMSGDGGSCAIDYGSESGGSCRIDGGTVVAAGGSAMAEAMDPESGQGFLMRNTDGEAGTAVTLRDGAGNVLISEVIPCGFSNLILSAPELRVGEECTLSVGEEEEQITVDNSSDAGGFGMGRMFGGGMAGGRGMGGMPGGRGAERISGGESTGEGTPGMPDERTPQMPEEEMPQTPDGEKRQMPEGMISGWPETGEAGERPAHFAGERQPAETGGRRGWPSDFAEQEASPVSGGTAALIGISVLALLAGILIAVKHR